MDSTTNLAAKRKRSQIASYAEPVEHEDFDEEPMIDTDDDEMPEGDTEYGSRRKPKKRKIRCKNGIAKQNTQPKKPFRFLDLPAELRDEIYKLALVEPGTMSLVFRMKASRRIVARGPVYERYGHRYFYHASSQSQDETETETETSSRLSPRLLAVNKQINFEASGHLYQQPMVFEDTRALYTFLAAIGPSNRPLLSTIVVKEWGCGRGTHKAMNAVALTSLAPCANLKKLLFDCNFGWRSSPHQIAKQLYRDGHYFMEAFGSAKGRKDAAIDVMELRNQSINGSVGTFVRDFQAQLRELLEEGGMPTKASRRAKGKF